MSSNNIILSKDIVPEDPSHKIHAILVNSKFENG